VAPQGLLQLPLLLFCSTGTKGVSRSDATCWDGIILRSHYVTYEAARGPCEALARGTGTGCFPGHPADVSAECEPVSMYPHYTSVSCFGTSSVRPSVSLGRCSALTSQPKQALLCQCSNMLLCMHRGYEQERVLNGTEH
jgi:hypothetical protein